MFLVAQAVVEPGDEVIIADPVDFLLERSRSIQAIAA